MASSLASIDDMEVVLEDMAGGCLDMEVDLPLEQHMIVELQACRNTMKVEMPTTTQKEFLGLPVESSRINYSDFLYIVLDTNVLLSHLKFLKELKDYSIRGVGKPVLIVPWVVIQELDSLKANTRKVSTQATNAGKFINDCLSANHPRVRGQTVDEVNTEVNNLAIVNNDDRILHCCLVYQHKIKVKGERGVVILFSNDTMLCAKAKINNMISCDRKNLLSELKRLSDVHSVAPVSYTHTPEYEGKLNRQLAEDEKSRLVDDCLCQAEGYVREALSIAVHHEMSRIFGNLCNDVMIRKPPWNLEDVIVMLDKHWVAVFRYVFNVQSIEKVKFLLTHSKNRASMSPRPPQVLLFIDNSLFLLDQLRSQTEVWSKINVLVASLKVLKEKMEKPTLPPSPPVTPTYSYPRPSNAMLANAGSGSSFCPPHLSHSLHQLQAQCPPLPVDQIRWLFQVVREALICGIISVQTSFANMSFTRETELWMLDLLRHLEGLIMAVENVLTQGLYVPVLRAFYDAILMWLSNMVTVSCPLTFSQLCDVCQMDGTIAMFQDGLGFMLDGRLQLLHLLHQATQPNSVM